MGKIGQNQGKLVAVIGFVEGFWEILAKFKPPKPDETGKCLFWGKNVAREFVQLGRCMSLSESNALPLSKLETAMYGISTVVVL